MKKILLTIFSALLLTSCYEDKGNYNYIFDSMDEINDLTLSPTPKEGLDNIWEIEYEQPMLGQGDQTKTVSINISTKFGNPDNFDYTWYRAYGRTRDTLQGREIQFLLPENRSTSYSCILKVTDKEYQIDKYYRLNVKTKPYYKNSLIVLHGLKGSRKLGNIDEAKEMSERVITDAWSRIYTTENPFKSAMCIESCVSSEDYLKGTSSMFVATDNGLGRIYNAYGLAQTYNEFAIYPQGMGYIIVPSRIYRANNDMRCGYMIDTNGKLYLSGSYMYQFFVAGSESASSSNVTDYEIAEALMLESYIVMWDKKNNRFLYSNYMANSFPYSWLNFSRSDATMNAAILPLDMDMEQLESAGLSPVGKTPILSYIQANESMYAANGRMLFIDEQGTPYLYRFNYDKAAGATFDSALKLDNLTLTEDTPIAYYNMLDPLFFYYASGNNLYRYNASNGVSQLVYSAPAKYQITKIKFRNRTHSYYGGNLEKIMDIALNNGNEGAVATIMLNNGGGVDKSFEPVVYEGFERVEDFTFAQDFVYENVTSD